MADVDEHKHIALEFANAHAAGGDPGQVVARATAYHAFLTGGPQVVAGTATQQPKQTGAQGGSKPAAAGGGGKPATQKPAADAGKPAGPEPTLEDVTKVLFAVRDADPKGQDVGLKTAKAFLSSAGGGATKGADLKPALYGAVIQACKKQLAAWKVPAPQQSTAQATVDEAADAFGGPEPDGNDGADPGSSGDL